MRSREEIAHRLSLCRRARSALVDAQAHRQGHPLGAKYREISHRIDALEWVLGEYAWERWLTPAAIEREIAKLEEPKP